jgi:hypothetical protein
VKYSSKPIVEFALTDNPHREKEKLRILREAEDALLDRYKGKRSQWQYRVKEEDFSPETVIEPLWDPEWHTADAFWMAEHVGGEPLPSPPGTKEIFILKELKPHNWFGTSEGPDLKTLPPGTYYIAVCSWDEDGNLSRPSNVVKIALH